MTLFQATPELPWFIQQGGALGLAGVLAYFYRQDRRENEKRWSELAGTLMEVVRDNTTAVTSLKDAISKTTCPIIAVADGRQVAEVTVKSTLKS